MSEGFSQECLECGEKLSPDMEFCPKCGSNKKQLHQVSIDKIKIRDSQKGELKDTSRKAKQKFVSRQKLGKNGKEAKEERVVDVARNWYFHHVDVQDENGNWKKDHHEDEPLSKHNEKQKKGNRT
jgi:predicted  nucleic acid-binding Zn-ribbon protein